MSRRPPVIVQTVGLSDLEQRRARLVIIQKLFDHEWAKRLSKPNWTPNRHWRKRQRRLQRQWEVLMQMEVANRREELARWPELRDFSARVVAADVVADTGHEVTCESCGQPLTIGSWPFCPHGRYLQRSGFEPRWDDGLGKYVTGWGDIHQAMRENKLDFRDHPTAGDLSARRDRIEQGKRTHGRQTERMSVEDEPIVPPPASVTVDHQYRAILFDASGRALIRRAGFTGCCATRSH